MELFYLNRLRASNTLLEFVDFKGQQADRMEVIDLRNCGRFTYESMAFTLKTVKSGKKRNANLYLEGSNAEKSDIERLTKTDMHWVCDVKGDGSARHDDVAVTIAGATKTGERKTGTLDRLFPLMGMSLDYDLEVMQTEGGKFVICQWEPEWFETIKSVEGSVFKGVPVHVKAYPEEGKRFRSVTVGGREIFSPWFIVSEPCEIKVNFSGEDNCAVFGVKPGQEITMLVMTTSASGSVYVDWGGGSRTEYAGQSAYVSGMIELKGTRITGVATGDEIRIYGDVAAIDLGGFGPIGQELGFWDNGILSADVTKCPTLRFLNLHWTPVTVLDLSKSAALEVLDVSMCDIKSLDFTGCPNLMWLEAYSDGFGDPKDHISMLTSIDLRGLPRLQYLDLHGNALTAIDLSGNTYLRNAILNGNKLESIDLSKNGELLLLNVSRNKLKSLDLSGNRLLKELNAGSNELTALDVSANTALENLDFSNNAIHSLNLRNLTALQLISINGNGMSADELNDFYYTLPVRIDKGVESPLSYDILVMSSGDKADNDGLRADSSIAEDRCWTPSHTGTNGGSETAYIDLLPSTHGTYTLTDILGKEYKSGMKVIKYRLLFINAVPEEGYVYDSYRLNDDNSEIMESFEMPGIYTKVRVNFERSSGVKAPGADGSADVKIIASGVNVYVSAESGSLVTIYRADGVAVAYGKVGNDGVGVFAPGRGVYVVKVDKASGGSRCASVAL